MTEFSLFRFRTYREAEDTFVATIGCGDQLIVKSFNGYFLNQHFEKLLKSSAVCYNISCVKTLVSILKSKN